jgi:hypothetical protein
VLERLGFCPDEITACEVRDGRFIVPAQLDGDVGLVLATARTSALTITPDYASLRGWPVEDHQLMRSAAVGYARDEVGFATVPTFAVLGTEGHFDRAVVGGIDRYRVTGLTIRPVVGAIGKSIFRGRALALDYQSSTIAVSSPLRAAWHTRSTDLVPAYRFAMAGEHGKLDPMVEGIQFFGVALKLYLDTGAWSSALSLDAYCGASSGIGLLDRFIRWRARSRFRARRPVPLFLTLPDGAVKRYRGYIMPSLRPWSEWIGVDRLDGWLGGNFLSHWVTVLDFDSGMISLFTRSA